MKSIYAAPFEFENITHIFCVKPELSMLLQSLPTA